MVLALVLFLIVVAAVLFNFLSPWTFTTLASNWGQIDTTLAITIAITGLAFVAVNLFMAYCLIRYRRRPGQSASHLHEHPRLEWTLIGITVVGIFALLSPGLFVYSKFIQAPPEALRLEVAAQQWQWSFRFPGQDGRLGRSEIARISGENPFGLVPEDQAGQDDVLVTSNTVHLPLGRPVKALLRSKDVLHDFYVPQFRVKMDIVPGLVSSVWFTPTRAGTFEIACAEFCGVGHYAMRGLVVVEPEAAFREWLAQQETFAQELGEERPAGETEDVQIDQGERLAQTRGCLGCHSVDGSAGVGPSWKGLFGRQETLADGGVVTVDEAYLRESIVSPTAKVVRGFAPLMPAFDQLGKEELSALIAYIKSLAGEE